MYEDFMKLAAMYAPTACNRQHRQEWEPLG